eukprot:scaffold91013_cov21-Tisochrysis_lutea.AAC.2
MRAAARHAVHTAAQEHGSRASGCVGCGPESAVHHPPAAAAAAAGRCCNIGAGPLATAAHSPTGQTQPPASAAQQHARSTCSAVTEGGRPASPPAVIGLPRPKGGAYKQGWGAGARVRAHALEVLSEDSFFQKGKKYCDPPTGGNNCRLLGGGEHLGLGQDEACRMIVSTSSRPLRDGNDSAGGGAHESVLEDGCSPALVEQLIAACK